MAVSAFTGFGHSLGNDEPRTDAVLTGAVCSEDAQQLCLETATSALTPEQDAVFALQERAAAADADEEVLAAQTVTPTPTPEPVTQAPAEPEPTEEPVAWATMQVREGDTLIALADWFGISPFDIAVFNGMAVDDYLLIGQTIWIPIPEDEFVMPPEAVIDTPEPIVAVPDPEPEQPAAGVVVPVATPVPAPPASSGSWTKDDAVDAICSLPWDCEKMVAVAACESGLRSDAVNPIGYYGLFQINFQWDGWDDPYENASVAYYQKYLPALNAFGDGLTPWPVCRYA